MNQATHELLDTLKSRGYRITGPRTKVIEWIADQNNPVTIQEIVANVNSDEATVYRTLATLKAEHLVEEIALPDNDTRYALTHGHHHHLVCENCYLIEHIPCEGQRLHPLEFASFASIARHEVTFYGICKKCS